MKAAAKIFALANMAIVANRVLGGPANVAKLIWRHLQRDGLRATLLRISSFAAGDAQAFSLLNYHDWSERYSAIDDDLRREMRDELAGWAESPRISLIMPVYNPPIEFLRAAIDSVCTQLYPHWELCIADDASTDPRVAELLREYRDSDSRIKVSFLERNSGISQASNVAAGMATSPWLALLDHDDVLTEHALYLVARTLREKPEIRLVYSDEDKISEGGVRYNPYFKPDWNPALFRSHNLIAHLGVYHVGIFRELGGFRSGFEGAQDYDLALRFVERIRAEQIFHIPHVLYHWRSHAASTADAGSRAKPYALGNGGKALNEHFHRCSLDATAEFTGYGYRVRYGLSSHPKVSIIISARDRTFALRRCVDSLLNLTDYPDFEIIIADHGSRDAVASDFLRRNESYAKIRILHMPKESAARESNGKVLVFLKGTLEVVHADWLREMVSHAVLPETGAVGALMLYPDWRVKRAGIVLGVGGWIGHAHRGSEEMNLGYVGRLALVSEFSAVSGDCLMVRRSVYEEFAGRDDGQLTAEFKDVDFCLRLREAGLRNVWTPFSKLVDYEYGETCADNSKEQIARFTRELAIMKERWGDKLEIDPCYNPNLTLHGEDFALACPPRIHPLALRAETNGSSSSP